MWAGSVGPQYSGVRSNSLADDPGRAAALTPFQLSPAPFVATATAIGVMVDAARTPVYLIAVGPQLMRLWLPIGLTTGGVLAGTLLGERVPRGLSRGRFGRLVGIAIGASGLWLMFTST